MRRQSASENKSNKLPEKVFLHRDSLMTDLLQVSHIRTVYHIFIAILVCLALDTILTDYFRHGSVFQAYHLEMVSWCFGSLSDTITCWLLMQLSTLLFYQMFIFWATNRPKVLVMTLFDYLHLVGYILYQATFTLLPAVLILKCDLPPGSSILIVCEQTRFIMKSHAFLRSNVVKAFVQTPVTPSATSSRKESYSFQSSENREEMSDPVNSEKVKQYLSDIDKSTKMSSGSLCPSFSHYVYFLFIPTLVYRDSYPRTDHIRWHYVASNFTQVLFCVIYNYFIFSKFLIPKFSSFNHHNFTFGDIILCITGSILPAGLLFVIVFFAMLHSWMNAFAELLRFGDRLFYKEWWNSKSFNTFYRTWNVVVHDWLYTYVYTDSYKLLKNKAAATFVVFFISSYVHEYIVSLTFKFCYPVLIIQFGGAGFLLTFLRCNGRVGNINFWISMLIGLGLQMALYAMEYYARQICRPVYENNPFWDFFVPRSWYCLPK